MRWLVGMERSGHVRDALIALGHEAVSCDLLSSDRPGPHIQGNVFDHLNDGWDGAILFPDCTYLTCSAEWAYNDPDFDRYPGVGYHQKVKPGTLVGAARREAREKAVEDFRRCMEAPIERIAAENPARGALSKRYRRPDQEIQPNWFGEDASKNTGLWLKGLPALRPTFRVPGRMVEWPRGSGKMVERWGNQTDSGQNSLTPSDDRAALRGITYIGIATAMAWQWAGVADAQLEFAA